MFIFIEMADVELVGVRLFTDILSAHGHFNEVMEELKLIEHDRKSLCNEVNHTLRMAGDDSASIQLIERKVMV